MTRPRAAIYARFSSELQRATSIVDQTSLCREFAAARGFDVVEVYADEATSGAAPILTRPGAARMHADALDGAFDVLLVEALDRLARNLVEQESLVRRLEHRGTRIVGVADGYDTASGSMRALARGVRGLIGEAYLADLRHKTHRGLAGQVGRGFHAGGRSFGYRSEAADGGRVLVVDEVEAAVVRWIFEAFGRDGRSCQWIAAELNRRGTPGPRGTWSASALYGTPKSRSGVLNNDLYRGRYVWNRREWVRDPDDPSRRIPRMRPPEQWRVVERPDLRIVSDDAWHAVRARIDLDRVRGGRKGRGGVPSTLFGGLVRCGRCGGAVVAIDARRYGCAARHDRGPAVCAGVAVPRDALDARLLSLARDDLLASATVAEVGAQVAAILRERRKAGADARKRARERADELDREIARLVDAVAAMGLSDALRARLAAAESERRGLGDADAPAPAPAAGGDWLTRYRAEVLRLREALAGDVPAARDAIRQVFGEIRLVAEGDAVFADVEAAGAAGLVAVAGGAPMGRVAGGRLRIRRRIR